MDFELNLILFDLLLLLLAYGYIFLTIYIPIFLKKKNLISKFIARKIVHLFAGLSVLTTPFFNYGFFALIIAGSLTMLAFFSSGDSKIKKLKELYDTIGEEAEEEKGYLQGPFHYCVAITLLIGLFVFLAPNQLYFPITGILIMIIADTMASLIGKRWGRIKIQFLWTGSRTVLGSLTMFGCSFILAFGAFWYFGCFNPLTQAPLTLNIVVLYSLITAIIACVIEILSPSTWDDLSVPIGCTLIMYLLVYISFI